MAEKDDVGEMQVDDGNRWRKYGQKAISNSPFPSYCRCTTASSCKAKKRVERCVDDPAILVTTYQGQHCHDSPLMMPRGSLGNEDVDNSVEQAQHKKCKGESMGSNVDEKKDTRKLTMRSPRMINQSEIKCRYPKVPEQEVSLRNLESLETEHAYTEVPETYVNRPPKNAKTFGSSRNRKTRCETSFFIGDPIPQVEAQERWGWRYQLKNQRSDIHSMKLNDDEEDEMILNVECHFAQANVGNRIFSLGDCVYVQGNEGKKDVGRVLEFFNTTDGENYFRVQWFYRVIKEVGSFHDKRRLFYSTIMNDNLIDCIVSKVNVTQISPRVGSEVKSIMSSDFYYDMEYSIDYSTFHTLVTGELASSHHQLTENNSWRSNSFSSSNLTDKPPTLQVAKSLGNSSSCDTYNPEVSLLDLYCGCGGMSTRLGLGAKLSSVNLITKWALDSDESACESLKLNDPETHVRNEAAEDFLELLKEWEKLCRQYEVDDVERTHRSRLEIPRVPKDDDEIATGEFEISRIIDICYGDPNKTGKRGVHFKVKHNETSDEMSFKNPPETDFQRYIRSTQYEMLGSALDNTTGMKNLLHDHRSSSLHTSLSDSEKKGWMYISLTGANFRDLPSVVVGSDNVARRDFTEKQTVLPSGKPLVPDYAFNFKQGKSKRYCQVGNAVAVPVARALGYALGLAFHNPAGMNHC